MRTRLKISALSILALILCAQVAGADTLVAVLEPVVLWESVELDLGGTVSGIASVTMRVVGEGGARCFYCSDIDDTLHQVHYPNQATVLLDEAYRVIYEPQMSAPYDEDLPVGMLPGTEDWAGLEDGSVSLHVSLAGGLPSPRCSFGLGCGTPFTLDRIELTITADHVVDAAPAAWSTIKAIYR